MARERRKRSAVFDESALSDVLEDEWPIPAEPTAPAQGGPESAVLESYQDPREPIVGANQERPAPLDPAAERRGPPLPEAPRPRTPNPGKSRPPEVSLSVEVYQRLSRVSASEKVKNRGKARTFGIIVLDAIEHHADRLATAWQVTPQSAPEPGALFVRQSEPAVPPRRRHVLPPRLVPLAGIDATNARLLDDFVDKWGTGTRSALVEQALRFEFNV
jgi:hypothetical protein